MAEFNAFTGGIELGGLRNQNDIRILICYVLASVGAPLASEDIVKILQDKSLANYFEINDAIDFLQERDNIKTDENGNYTVTDSGREIAAELDTVLPLTVRDKALESALTLMTRAKNEWENRVEVNETENGLNVEMHVSGGEFDLMTVSLMVPNKKQAKLVKENFHNDPQRLYGLVIAALTNDTDMQRELFEEK